MKKLLTILILSILMIGQAQAQFICKSLGDNNQYNLELFKCREEAYIDFSTWYN